MTKHYQPSIIEYSKNIIDTLIETEFFSEHDITDYEFANDFLCQKLTEKFINGELNLDEGVFTEEEFDEILRYIIAGSILNKLKNSGYLNSYEDENTEEVFFITDLGKEYLEELQKEYKENIE